MQPPYKAQYRPLDSLSKSFYNQHIGSILAVIPIEQQEKDRKSAASRTPNCLEAGVIKIRDAQGHVQSKEIRVNNPGRISTAEEINATSSLVEIFHETALKSFKRYNVALIAISISSAALGVLAAVCFFVLAVNPIVVIILGVTAGALALTALCLGLIRDNKKRSFDAKSIKIAEYRIAQAQKAVKKEVVDNTNGWINCSLDEQRSYKLHAAVFIAEFFKNANLSSPAYPSGADFNTHYKRHILPMTDRQRQVYEKSLLRERAAALA